MCVKFGSPSLVLNADVSVSLMKSSQEHTAWPGGFHLPPTGETRTALLWVVASEAHPRAGSVGGSGLAGYPGQGRPGRSAVSSKAECSCCHGAMRGGFQGGLGARYFPGRPGSCGYWKTCREVCHTLELTADRLGLLPSGWGACPEWDCPFPGAPLWEKPRRRSWFGKLGAGCAVAQ